MSLQQQQNLLAKLYTDTDFRRAFLSEPAKIGAEHDLSDREIREIAEIMPEELNLFADSLFWKRLREAEKFLPLTKKTLSDDFTKYFREFSQNFNPQSVKKHLEDAFGFCGFLQKQNISEFGTNAAKYERSKLEFYGFERRLVVCRLDFDFRKIDFSEQKGEFEIPDAKKTIAVWLRIGKRTRHFFI